MKRFLQRPTASWPGLLCSLVLLGLSSQLSAVGQETGQCAIKMRRGGGSTLSAASQWPRATLDQTTAGFTVEQGSVPAVFEYLFNRDHLIVGIELIEPVSGPASAPAPSLEQVAGTFSPGTLRALLDQVVSSDTALAWIEERSVVNLVYRANLDDPNYVFNRTVASFDADDLPYYRAVQNLFVSIRTELGGPPAGGGLRYDPDGGPRVTIHLQQATVRRILNEIAWQAGVGWRVMYKQGDQMMGILITPQFSLESECEGCPTALIEPSAPPVISHLDEVSDEPSADPAALLPLRDTLAPAGFAFTWDSRTRTASAAKGTTRIVVTDCARVAALNGIPVALSVPVAIKGGRILVPRAFLRLVDESLGGTA